MFFNVKVELVLQGMKKGKDSILKVLLASLLLRTSLWTLCSELEGATLISKAMQAVLLEMTCVFQCLFKAYIEYKRQRVAVAKTQ